MASSMTSEMVFECLLVSCDPDVFSIVARVLRDLSISIDVCLHSSQAIGALGNGSIDLVVIDWEGEASYALLQSIWKDLKGNKPTVVAISSSDSPLPGAHILVKKPVTLESVAKSFRVAYGRMLLEYRRHVRHAVMTPVIAALEGGREISLTVTDIGDGGVGLCTRSELIVGDVLSFWLNLPGAMKEVLVHVRVLWTREYSRAGCEFVRIPPVDLMILHDWLRLKSQVKKPRIAV